MLHQISSIALLFSFIWMMGMAVTIEKCILGESRGLIKIVEHFNLAIHEIKCFK